MRCAQNAQNTQNAQNAQNAQITQSPDCVQALCRSGSDRPQRQRIQCGHDVRYSLAGPRVGPRWMDMEIMELWSL